MTKHHYYLAGKQENVQVYARVTPTGIEYPWPTYREAQRLAARDGAKAVFHDSLKEASDAVYAEGGGA